MNTTPSEDYREIIKDKRVVASVSGGKDSAALSLYLHSQGIDHDRIFCDTGWEHPFTYCYTLRRDEAIESVASIGSYSPEIAEEVVDKFITEYGEAPLQKAIGPITKLKAERRMMQLIRHHGAFSARRRKYCTRELKTGPASVYFEAMLDNGIEPVNAVGIRSDESLNRSTMTEWDYFTTESKEEILTWRPLIQWTFDQVVDIHKEYGLIPNPLYLLGASRVGCWPCIFSRKSEIRLVSEVDPRRIDLIESLENELAIIKEGKDG